MPKQTNKLSVEQLEEVLEFANGLYNGVQGYGLYNPFVQNNNLLGLNGKSVKPTQEDLNKALEKSPYDYKKLAEYSSFYNTFDSIYNKTIRYFISLLSFDLTYSCINIKNPTEYNSKEYNDDIHRVWKFLDKFDYKQEFKKILKLMCVRDTVYTWFRDSQEIDTPIELDETKVKKGERFAIQILPQDICKTSGYFNNSQLLFDIDMNYFLNPTVDINLYAPQLKQMLRNAYNGNDDYNPSSQFNRRNGGFANYMQCNPNYGAYAFKFDTSTFAQTPPFVSMLKSCMSNDDVAKLQMDKNILSAYEVLAGEIKTLNDTKVSKPDQFAISPKTLGQFMSLCTQGLKQTNVKASALPLENLKMYQYQDYTPSSYSNQLKASAGQGASTSELIYHDENLSQFLATSAQESDYAFIKQAYSQFNQFLNFFINKKTKKYKFDFRLDGMDRTWWKKEKSDAMRNLADKGFTLPPQYWASIVGVDVQNFVRGLEEAHAINMEDKYLTLLLNANTMKDGSDNSNGRPKAEGLNKSDKTEEVGDYV